MKSITKELEDKINDIRPDLVWICKFGIQTTEETRLIQHKATCKAIYKKFVGESEWTDDEAQIKINALREWLRQEIGGKNENKNGCIFYEWKCNGV